jgi:hypothetical protein
MITPGVELSEGSLRVTVFDMVSVPFCLDASAFQEGMGFVHFWPWLRIAIAVKTAKALHCRF